MMREAIKQTKEFMLPQMKLNHVLMRGVAFDTYQKVYAQTNENIEGYMSQLNWEKKDSVLTVLGSGDHVWNAVFHGATNIHTYDTNSLTEYYALGIKKSALLTFSYKDYLIFIKDLIDPSTSPEELYSMIQKLYPNMEQKYQLYWDELLKWNIEHQGKAPYNFFRFFLINYDSMDESVLKNGFLENEESYNLLKKNLKKANITFEVCDYKELPQKVSTKYDFLFLSNILDYEYRKNGIGWNYRRLKEIEEQLSSCLKEDGILALNYLYSYCNGKGKPYYTKLFHSSNVTRNDIQDEEFVTFSKIKENRKLEIQDALIYKKIKK